MIAYFEKIFALRPIQLDEKQHISCLLVLLWKRDFPGKTKYAHLFEKKWGFEKYIFFFLKKCCHYIFRIQNIFHNSMTSLDRRCIIMSDETSDVLIVHVFLNYFFP